MACIKTNVHKYYMGLRNVTKNNNNEKSTPLTEMQKTSKENNMYTVCNIPVTHRYSTKK